MEYNFSNIEEKWQAYWKENKTYKVNIDHTKPKYYVLDMFPYPSGAGLHVGHPLGYIASDIYSRFKTLKGFNVLHPMGYDAYGLPAEQYAIQTGKHPALTTDENIKRYRNQLDKIGFSYDWDREVKTSEPEYYKWTQWVFIKLFHHWFNNKSNKAETIEDLISEFGKTGNKDIDAACSEIQNFSAEDWNSMSETEQQTILQAYRLAYQAETMVNWCPALGTVLANDEVKDGFSVRGGNPVVQKKMTQWLLRVSAYAERLLSGLDKINWSDSLKEIQSNWIGKSIGGEILFPVKNSDVNINVFTTRPDTIFGVTFMVLAPESEYADLLTTEDKRDAVNEYFDLTQKRTERERISEVKQVSGVFTGSYAIHPFSGEEIPIWISDYVLAGYGTGAIMAVPGHDSRDFAFARHFNLPVKQVVVKIGDKESDTESWTESYDSKEGEIINSDFINGLNVENAISKVIENLVSRKIGMKKVNYRLRDAIFSRQRYWGEPFPVYYKNGFPYTLDEDKLPLELPLIDKFLPTEDGQPPLGRAKNWQTTEGFPYELNTMPGFAGSSAYYIRYMDPRNNDALVSKEANKYWQDVDLYIGGTEHATGHLVYSRFWNKFLYDIGIVCKDEPFQKLVNQGMIQGRSNFVYRIRNSNKFVSLNSIKEYDVTPIHVDVNIVNNDILDIEAFKKWNPEYKNAEFILDGDKYICGWAVEKMSKSMFNVVNPDDIISRYGADTLRLYEMFLGPLEQSKPWDTNGIDGVHRFIKKLWRLFFDKNGDFNINEEEPSKNELKSLHKTIKKITGDIEKFSFNTSVSAFMICVNELTELNCNKKKILEPLIILISPFAPHIAEELWHMIGNEKSITVASFPTFDEKYLIENTFEYPVSFNGKMRFKIEFPLNMSNDEMEKTLLNEEGTIKWLEGKLPKKIVIVPGRIINIVI